MEMQQSDARLLAQAFDLDKESSEALDSLMRGQVTPLAEGVRERLQEVGIVFAPIETPCFKITTDGLQTLENRYSKWIDRAP